MNQHLYAQTVTVIFWVAIVIGLLVGLHLMLRALSIYTWGRIAEWRDRCRYHDTQLAIHSQKEAFK